MTTPMRAEVWLDPLCPWAYMTSLWMDEVVALRGVEVTWSVMSLSVLNEGRDLPADYQKLMAAGWAPARSLIIAADRYGPPAIKTLYGALTTRIHRQGRKDYDDILVESLSQCGYDAEIAALAHTDAFDAQLRASHARAMEWVGDEVGTPVIAVEGVAFFGPVVSPAPRGQDAINLWEGCRLVAGTPGFFELKRTRTVGPQFPSS